MYHADTTSIRPGRKSSPWEPEPRQLEAYAEYTKGAKVARIAEEFGVANSTVTAWIRLINRWLVAELVEDVKEIRCQHTQSLMHLFREAMAGWERSKTDRVVRSKKSGHKPGENGGPFDEKSTTREGQSGNPAFLSEARAALADIRKMWGADEPKRIDIQGEFRVAGVSRSDAYKEWIKRNAESIREVIAVEVTEAGKDSESDWSSDPEF